MVALHRCRFSRNVGIDDKYTFYSNYVDRYEFSSFQKGLCVIVPVDLILIANNQEQIVGHALPLETLPTEGSDLILHNDIDNSTILCRVIEVCWYIGIINEGKDVTGKVMVRITQIQDMSPVHNND